MIPNEIKELESDIGFPVKKAVLSPESRESYDESFSYGLCQRFYRKGIELDIAIGKATSVLLHLMKDKGTDSAQIAVFFSLLGNMYYINDDFKKAIGCFMKSLSHNKRDMTAWIELMFALRADGNFQEFEGIMFNLEKIHNLWISDPEAELTRNRLYSVIGRL